MLHRIAAVTSITLCAAIHAGAQGSTDIYLAPLSLQNGRPVVGTPVNVTNRPGYDNQPSFTPDSKSILYTSTRKDGQSDIYKIDIAKIDIATKTISRVTSTHTTSWPARRRNAAGDARPNGWRPRS